MIEMRHGWFLPIQALIRGIGIQIDHSGKGEQINHSELGGTEDYNHLFVRNSYSFAGNFYLSLSLGRATPSL